MLGKGLESLIPNKNPNQGNGGSSASPNPGNSQDNSRQPSSAPYNPKNSQPSQDGPVFLPIQDLASEDFLPEEPGADELLEDGVEEDELLEDGSKEEHEGKTDPQPAKTRPAPQQQPAASSTMPSQAVRSEEKPEEKKVYVPRQESFQQTRQSSPASHDHSEKPYEAVFHIEVEKIKPNPQQPRRDFNQDAIKELAASIREFGILQPLVVTKVVKEVPTGTDVEYYLIAGERRLRAAKYLGLERVPAVIKNVDLEKERLELAIIENLQRENLNPVEMGRAFARLQDEFRLTQREIAARLGKSREAVANTMRLLDLPPEIQEAVASGRISESHGRLLLAIEDPVAQEKLFRDLVDKHLTTRELKNRVQTTKTVTRHGGESSEVPEFRDIQEKLSSELGAPVKISGEAGGGKITITFYSKEELENILNKLRLEEEGF